MDQFFFHCCAPQIKIQKHKTTGKGKTKQGEPVYMEQIHQVHGVTHEFYELREIHEFSENYSVLVTLKILINHSAF